MGINLLDLLIERVKSEIESQRLEKAELCRKAGISRPTLDRLLGGNSPTLETIEAIASALGRSPWDLLRPRNEPISPFRAVTVLADLFQRLGPEFVVRLAALDDTEIQGLREALSPGSTLNEARLRLDAKTDDADENSG